MDVVRSFWCHISPLYQPVLGKGQRVGEGGRESLASTLFARAVAALVIRADVDALPAQ